MARNTSSYANDTDMAQMTAEELLALWQGLSEERRLAFLGSLHDDAADQLLALQLRRKEIEDAAKRHKALPHQSKSWPAGSPTDQWSDKQLAAYLAYHETALAEIPLRPAKTGEAI